MTSILTHQKIKKHIFSLMQFKIIDKIYVMIANCSVNAFMLL